MSESTTTMFPSWKIGRPFGIEVYVHWTFFLLPLFVAFQGLQSRYPVPAAVEGVTLVFAVFGCVILHELGHALTARRFGIRTRDITLYPIGGVARLERMSERPWEEFWIAVAGPAVNVVIALVLAGLIGAVDGFESLVMPPSGVVEWFKFLIVSNVVLVAFNLLPAFPSDGGRVLRALLSGWLGRLRATEIAAGLGTVTAAGMGLWGLFAWDPFLVFIAVVLYFAGQQELAAVRQREWYRSREPREVEPIDGPPTGEATQGPDFSGFTWDPRARLWIYWRNGRPIRSISLD